jgi:dipeptidyl aminopeptidase/acylaminoacyl peptidase
MMKQYLNWRSALLLLLLALSLQSCLGLGDNSNSNFKSTNTGSGQLGVNQGNQVVFQGKIYFTINHHLWVLDGTRNLHQLTGGKTAVRDPAASPDGKWMAFDVIYKNSSDLVYMPINGGKLRMLRSGAGGFYYKGQFVHSSNTWNVQPAWATDGSHLLFLSDFEKEDWYSYTGIDAPLLDLQVFSIPLSNPSAVQDVAYAYFGDGGNRDPSYRPGHPDQIIYTHYAYDVTRTQQLVQLFMENPNAIASYSRGHYYPGEPGFDPGVAITPPNVECIEPAFSPNGNFIAYIKRISTDQMGLYVMPTPENITSSPNSSTVAKKALLPYKQSSLIIKGQFISQPFWSPDGKQIAYLSYNNQSFDIWLATVTIDPKTGRYVMKGSPVQLTNGGIDGDSRPVWTA